MILEYNLVVCNLTMCQICPYVGKNWSFEKEKNWDLQRFRIISFFMAVNEAVVLLHIVLLTNIKSSTAVLRKVKGKSIVNVHSDVRVP